MAVLMALLLVARALPLDPGSRASSESSNIVASAVRASSVRVIDGDTVELLMSGERIRIANLDAAETAYRAHCAAERMHGEEAKIALRRLVGNARTIEVNRSGRLDRYGRTIAYLQLDGRDAGDLLISSGLARPWEGHRRPWCASDGTLIR